MADDDDNEQAASGGNKKLIIIAALVSVLLGGGGAAAVLTLTGGDKSVDVAEAEATEQEVTFMWPPAAGLRVDNRDEPGRQLMPSA